MAVDVACAAVPAAELADPPADAPDFHHPSENPRFVCAFERFYRKHSRQ
jgi:hypothetical protein